jgi:AcrR family transcriptional regulator
MKSITAKKPRKPASEALWAIRREEILDAAARLFARHGYPETDTQLLADELGVGKGTLYRYFASKEELFFAAVDRAMERMKKSVEDGIAALADPLEQIAEAVRLYLAFFAEHPDFVELMMQERAQFKHRGKEASYCKQREESLERWHELYRALIARGRIRDMPVERITDVFSDLVYGTMFNNYFTGRKKKFEAQAKDIVDVVFNGILSDAERQAPRSK